MNEAIKPNVASVPLVSWQEIKTNPYNQSLHKKMLDEGGYVIRKQVKLKLSTLTDEPVDCYVKYDTQFVHRKLLSVLKPLLEAEVEDRIIISLIKQMLESYHNYERIQSDYKVPF
ncbi:hypothetical protein BCD67_24700 [Oscillatoriales cyanobacterium USR001]|nr:hypothetical protein BCD67_24700 [Oscillatoriales cyanobacterium USR001]